LRISRATSLWFAINSAVVPAAIMCALFVPYKSAQAGDGNKLLAAAPNASKSVLQFRLHLVSTTKYVYNNDGEILDHKLQKVTAKNGDFQLDEEIVDDNGLISIRLSYKGKSILSKQLPRWKGLCEDSFVMIDPLKNESCNKSPVFRDINGDGIPEMILVMDSGSAHGTVDQTIYQIRSDTKPLHELCHATLQSPAFLDSEHNGIYNLVIDDQTFAYWKDSAYCDYSPTYVVLSLKGSTWVPNARLMTEPPPNKANFEKIIQELDAKLAPFDKLSQSKTRAITPPVWSCMTQYVYSGNADLAKAVMNRLYPTGTTLVVAANGPENLKAATGVSRLSREQFWKDFCDNVKKSEYAKTLLGMDTHKILQSRLDPTPNG
jgi:hypothetical protein